MDNKNLLKTVQKAKQGFTLGDTKNPETSSSSLQGDKIKQQLTQAVNETMPDKPSETNSNEKSSTDSQLLNGASNNNNNVVGNSVYADDEAWAEYFHASINDRNEPYFTKGKIPPKKVLIDSVMNVLEFLRKKGNTTNTGAISPSTLFLQDVCRTFGWSTEELNPRENTSVIKQSLENLIADDLDKPEYLSTVVDRHVDDFDDFINFKHPMTEEQQNKFQEAYDTMLINTYSDSTTQQFQRAEDVYDKYFPEDERSTVDTSYYNGSDDDFSKATDVEKIPSSNGNGVSIDPDLVALLDSDV